MMGRIALGLAFFLSGSVGLSPTLAFASCVYGPFSTCTIVIVQNPAKPSCINSFNPDVVRLCPSTASPVYDRVTFNVTLLDALGQACTGADVHAYESSGSLNIVNGETVAATSDAGGRASITIRRASGCGRLSICAGGVMLCDVSVRSVDLANGALPGGCPLPTAGSSYINANDMTNPACGILAKFGVVTAGVNDCWDNNCDGLVNASDITPDFSGGGILRHFGHGGALGATSVCP